MTQADVIRSPDGFKLEALPLPGYWRLTELETGRAFIFSSIVTAISFAGVHLISQLLDEHYERHRIS